jgi:exosortase
LKALAIPRGQILVGALALLALWFVLCRQLSGEWSVNEQYSYGWFVPFFAALLFWLRWEDRPEIGGRKSDVGGEIGFAIGVAILALLVLFPVRLFEVANPDWRPLGWIHAAAVIAVTLVLIYLAGGWPWVRHFSFPVLFFFVAVPWVSPIEEPIVQGLMRIVASLAAEIVSLFGIPAQVQGNLIRIANGVVGVNEACSGVRSLQTSLMIGLLFGELKRFAASRRIILLAAAVLIALIANLGRAIFLVWIASARELAAVDRWHDFAGYAIVALVFCGSFALAALLKRDGKVRIKNEELRKGEDTNTLTSDLRPPTSPFDSVAPARSILLPTSYFLLCLLWLLAIEAGVESWYRVHERDLIPRMTWNVRPPENVAGLRELKIDEGVRQTLRFDSGRELTWKNSEAGASGSTTNYLYFFRWNPGSSSVIRARAHRPDICLPSSGWTQTGDRGLKTYSSRDGIVIPAHHAIFKQETGNVTVHTFFSLQEDRARPDEARPNLEFGPNIRPDWAARARMVRRGVRNLGQQILEFAFLSNHPMDDQTAEEKFGQLVRETVERK